MTDIFQAVWPIIDDNLTPIELITEARELIAKMAERAHCLITGPPEWSIHPADEVMGWEAHDGLVLIARAPAEPFPTLTQLRRKVEPDHAAIERAIQGEPGILRRPTDRTGAVLQLHAGRLSDATVASRLRMRTRAVEQTIHRHTKSA